MFRFFIPLHGGQQFVVVQIGHVDGQLELDEQIAQSAHKRIIDSFHGAGESGCAHHADRNAFAVQ